MTDRPSTRHAVRLTVNDKPVQAEVQAHTLLVEFLREALHLTGTHVGCDTSQCGACVVELNGNSVKSCTMLAVQANGATVRTIEGVGAENTLNPLNPLQQAFTECHALQCGFCTPGMVMAASDLLRKNPTPTTHEIREWLDGNLCRCTGYNNIVRAISLAASRAAESRR